MPYATDPEFVPSPAPEVVTRHIQLVDALLKKHFGINIDDTELAADAEQDVLDGIRPYEVVNSHAAKHDLGRLDIEGHYGLPSHIDLTDQDEALFVS